MLIQLFGIVFISNSSLVEYLRDFFRKLVLSLAENARKEIRTTFKTNHSTDPCENLGAKLDRKHSRIPAELLA